MRLTDLFEIVRTLQNALSYEYAEETGTRMKFPFESISRGRRSARLLHFSGFLLLVLVFVSGCSALAAETPASTAAPPEPVVTIEPTFHALILEQRDPDVPDLPFSDNPDPSQCGIPTAWGLDTPAWLTGFYEGELIQPTVFLYDSHLRLGISAQAPHGSEVEILLYQENPVMDYYLVKIKSGDNAGEEGWIPEPFLSFEPLLDG